MAEGYQENYLYKSSGSTYLEQCGIGIWYTSNKLTIFFPYPFLCKDTSYTINFNYINVFNVGVVGANAITIDKKLNCGIRVYVQISGSAGNIGMGEAAFTISY